MPATPANGDEHSGCLEPHDGHSPRAKVALQVGHIQHIRNSAPQTPAAWQVLKSRRSRGPPTGPRGHRAFAPLQKAPDTAEDPVQSTLRGRGQARYLRPRSRFTSGNPACPGRLFPKVDLLLSHPPLSDQPRPTSNPSALPLLHNFWNNEQSCTVPAGHLRTAQNPRQTRRLGACSRRFLRAGARQTGKDGSGHARGRPSLTPRPAGQRSRQTQAGGWGGSRPKPVFVRRPPPPRGRGRRARRGRVSQEPQAQALPTGPRGTGSAGTAGANCSGHAHFSRGVRRFRITLSLWDRVTSYPGQPTSDEGSDAGPLLPGQGIMVFTA